ncbi:MAG: hypothetical protein ACRDEB_06260, partial [Chitinophagaceae bacterium]
MKSKTKMVMPDQVRDNKSAKSFFSFNLFTGFIMTTVIMLASCMSQPKPTAGKAFNNVDEKGVILDGYDPVAFFTDNMPVKGSEEF